VSCRPDAADGAASLYIKRLRRRAHNAVLQHVTAAYEALSDRMKAYLEGMTACMTGRRNYRGTYAYAGVGDKPNYPRAETSGDQGRIR